MTPGFLAWATGRIELSSGVGGAEFSVVTLSLRCANGTSTGRGLGVAEFEEGSGLWAQMSPCPGGWWELVGVVGEVRPSGYPSWGAAGPGPSCGGLTHVPHLEPCGPGAS